MHPSSPRRTRLAAGTLAVLLASSLVACGVDATEGTSNAPGGGSPIGSTTTTTAPCADNGGGDDGGNTGGTVGADDQLPECAPTPTTGDTTTTTEDTTTTTEGTDTDRQAYVDALASSIVGRDDLGVPVSSDQADCLAPRWIDALDPARLADADIDPETLGGRNVVYEVLQELIGRPEATEMVSALTDCGLDLEGALITEIGSRGTYNDEEVQCIVDSLPDGYIEKVVAISLADGRDALDAEPGLTEPLTDAVLGCT